MNNLSKYIFIAIIISLQCGCSNLAEKSRESNEDIFESIACMSLSDPEKALASIDSSENEGLLTPFEISFLRCLAYHNGYSDYRKALSYGLSAYNMPDAPKDVHTRLRLIDLIADEYLNNGDYKSSVKFCTEGLRLAQDSLVKDNDLEANLHVTLGLNLLESGSEEEAFYHLRNATKILASLSKENYENADNYIYALGMTANSLVEKGLFDEAAGLMDEYMTGVENLEKFPDAIDGLADCRRSSGYALLAYIHSKKDEMEKAKKYYDLYCKTDYSSAPEGEQIRIPYLLASRRFDEAMYYIQREKKIWHENADTISRAYIDEHLNNEREAYEGLGDYRSANHVAHIIEAVSDSLRTKDTEMQALELAEIYKTNVQAVRLEHQTYSIKIRNIAIVFALIVIALATIFIVSILRQNRAIARKNDSMAATIDELMDFKDELFEMQSENILLRNMLKKDVSPCSDKDGTGCNIIAVTTSDDLSFEKPNEESAARLSDSDRDLWDKMSHDIIGKKLYLESELSKNWLIKNYRIPVNKFAMLFREFAGCTFSQYIQNCRLDHAVRLMRLHPNWSLESIAKEVQMSRATFYSRFQEKYGMSPTEFKDRDRDKFEADNKEPEYE